MSKTSSTLYVLKVNYINNIKTDYNELQNCKVNFYFPKCNWNLDLVNFKIIPIKTHRTRYFSDLYGWLLLILIKIFTKYNIEYPKDTIYYDHYNHNDSEMNSGTISIINNELQFAKIYFKNTQLVKDITYFYLQDIEFNEEIKKEVEYEIPPNEVNDDYFEAHLINVNYKTINCMCIEEQKLKEYQNIINFYETILEYHPNSNKIKKN